MSSDVLHVPQARTRLGAVLEQEVETYRKHGRINRDILGDGPHAGR